MLVIIHLPTDSPLVSKPALPLARSAFPRPPRHSYIKPDKVTWGRQHFKYMSKTRETDETPGINEVMEQEQEENHIWACHTQGKARSMEAHGEQNTQTVHIPDNNII